MYKRLATELHKTADDSFSESDEDQSSENLESGSDVSNSNEDGSGSSEPEVPSEEEEIIQAGLVTMEELEAGSKGEKTKPGRQQELLYECSICPEKRLTSLEEVSTHIVSKVRSIQHNKRHWKLCKFSVGLCSVPWTDSSVCLLLPYSRVISDEKSFCEQLDY